MKKFVMVALLFFFLWAFSGCSAVPFLMSTPTLTATPKPTLTSTPLPTPSPSPTLTVTPSPTATATPVIELSPPAAGKASAAGLVLWNGKPVQYVKVLLCQEFFQGCSGNEYSTNSDEKGRYVFKDVKPGEYKLVVNVPNTDWYIYNTEKKETLEADQIRYFDAVHIFKVDLRVKYPTDNMTISEDRPTLTWKEYSGASYYEVVIWTQYFADIQEFQQVQTTEYTIQAPLPEGYYIWELSAFNADGIKIAEAEGVHFTVDKP